MVECKVLGGEAQPINCHGCADACDSCKIPGIIIEDGCLCGDCVRERGCTLKPSHSCSLFTDPSDLYDLEDRYEMRERESRIFGIQNDAWVERRP